MIADRLIALIAFAVFAGFLGIIIFSVQHTVLIIVAVIGISFVAFDFWTQVFPRRRGSRR